MLIALFVGCLPDENEEDPFDDQTPCRQRMTTPVSRFDLRRISDKGDPKLLVVSW